MQFAVEACKLNLALENTTIIHALRPTQIAASVEQVECRPTCSLPRMNIVVYRGQIRVSLHVARISLAEVQQILHGSWMQYACQLQFHHKLSWIILIKLGQLREDEYAMPRRHLTT